MHYVSPFNYLPEDLIKDILLDTNKIKLARKKLLAEIELSDTQSILVNNKELTKSDIITLFDSLNNAQLLNIHLAIFNNKNLLGFLENSIIPSFFNFTDSQPLNTDEAINFISPYYKDVAWELINTAIKTKDNVVFCQFFLSQHLLNNEDTFEIYELVSKRLSAFAGQLKLLEKKIENKGRIIKKDIEALELKAHILLLNSLPNDFDKLRDDIACDINALGCDLINNSYNRFAKDYFFDAVSLNCSNAVKKHFNHNVLLSIQRKDKYPKTHSIGGFFYNIVHFNNGKIVLNNKKRLVSFIFIMIFLRGVVVDLIHPNESSSNSPNVSNTFTIGALNTDKPTDKAHYPAYSKADSSFNSLMSMLDLQDGQNYKADTARQIFKKGDNVFKQLFSGPAFALNKHFTVSFIGAKKTVWFINNTSSECIIITRISDIQSDDSLFTTSLGSYYLPKNDSIAIQLKDGCFTDVRPYFGSILVKNIDGYKNWIFNPSQIKFKPNYLFKKVPTSSKNLLEGMGMKFNALNDSARIKLRQEYTGEFVFDIN